MTTPSPLYGQFGTSLAFAERTLTATLRAHLAKRGVRPETWYALKLVGTRGPGIPRAELHGDLASARGLDSASADELLARLAAEGLIRGDERVDLTTAGEALYLSLSDYVTGSAAELLSQFDVRDIETTIRTMQAITKRAAEEAAAGA